MTGVSKSRCESWYVVMCHHCFHFQSIILALWIDVPLHYLSLYRNTTNNISSVYLFCSIIIIIINQWSNNSTKVCCRHFPHNASYKYVVQVSYPVSNWPVIDQYIYISIFLHLQHTHSRVAKVLVKYLRVGLVKLSQSALPLLGWDLRVPMDAVQQSPQLLVGGFLHSVRVSAAGNLLTKCGTCRKKFTRLIQKEMTFNNIILKSVL